MLNLNKTVVVKIDPKFSAEDWQLYTASMPCTKVANALNKSLKTLVNNGNTQQHVYESMITIMGLYSNHGASDTEPHWFLQHILSHVYDR
jgi:hypothetical protein